MAVGKAENQLPQSAKRRITAYCNIVSGTLNGSYQEKEDITEIEKEIERILISTNMYWMILMQFFKRKVNYEEDKN